MRKTLEPAFLIHTRPYRETSVIAQWFTRNHGRVTSVVRGARGKQKRRNSKPHLLPFCEYQISWYGTGEMVTTTSWESLSNVWFNGKQLTIGLYINELIMRLFTQGDAHPSFYAQYTLMLRALESKSIIQPLIRQFELLLLKELGYEVVLNQEAISGRPIEIGQSYRFEPDIGFVKAKDGGHEDNYPGSLLLNMAENNSLSRVELKMAKRLTREALTPHVGSKPLTSRDLLFPGIATGTTEQKHETSP